MSKPWTEDPTLQTVYFCNVHREDDKVTQWIRNNIPYQEDGLHEWRMMVARMFNWPPTLKAMDLIAFSTKLEEKIVYGRLISTINSIRESGEKVWGNAYVVTTCGKRMDKGEYCSQALGAAFANPPHVAPNSTLAAAHKLIMQYQGFASFMAAQVVADLKNTIDHPLEGAEDWYSWSAPGPGSIRGLNWFFYDDKFGKVSPKRFNHYITLAWEMLKGHVMLLCMQDFQNCLCEFDKYMRVSTGAGRSKRKYNGK